MPDDDPTMKLPEPGANPTANHSVGELLARALGDPGPTGGGRWVPPTSEELSELLPQYRIESLLGQGGMGAVYKGVQVALKRPVAIKLLPLEISADPAFAKRFEHEAQTLAKLSHPNIVGVYDFGATSEGHLYFVMEFVEGTDLHKMIHGPGLSPAQTLSIIIAVCEALQYAHGKGVVHRDIKPANVMVSTEGTVKVADFGLARLNTPDTESGGLTMTGTVMGTPAYMAPEQTRGMHVDHRADIYSLGVMLYEMLCGEIPRGVFDPPSRKVQVDVRLDEVVLRAMNSEPERRYQNTVEMKTDVDAIRTTNAEGGKRKAKRKSHRGRVAAVIAAWLALAGVAGFLVWKRAHQPGGAALAETAAQSSPALQRVAPSATDGRSDGLKPSTTLPAALSPSPNLPVPPASATASTSAWQPLFTDAEWRATSNDRDFKDGLLHLHAGTEFKKAPPSPIQAIRARVHVRDAQATQGGVLVRQAAGDGRYKFGLNQAGAINLSYYTASGAKSDILGAFTFLKPHQVGDTLLLELRLQGSHLTGLVNGAIVIEAQDNRLTAIGECGIMSRDGWFESVEVQSLAAVAPVVSPSSPATEPTAVQTFAGHRYQFVPGKFTWHQARACH